MYFSNVGLKGLSSLEVESNSGDYAHEYNAHTFCGRFLFVHASELSQV